MRDFLATVRAIVRLHPLAAVATVGVVAVSGGAAMAAIATRDGGWGATSPVSVGGGVPRGDLTIRALGDSVTAGFGYYADGSPVPAGEILGGVKDRILAAPGKFLFGIPGDVGRCLPPTPPDGRCQSPAQIAYPAVFARQLRIPVRRPSFENLAVSGSTPLDWLGPRFGDELSRIVRDDPDLTVLTLGANPLLQDFLGGHGVCARTPLARHCIDGEIKGQQVEERLARMLERLLATNPRGRRGDVVVFTYHEAHPIPAFGAAVSVLLERLNEAIEGAVSRARTADPANAGRLLVVDPPSFADHQCEDEEPWVLLTDSCIHPNALGQEMFATALVEAVASRLPPPGSRPAAPRPAARPPNRFAIEVTPGGQVIRLGAFEPQQYLGRSGAGAGVRPTLANAIAAYGRPASRSTEEVLAGCSVRWPRLSLTAITEDFGGGPVCGNGSGVVEVAVVDAGARRWRTDRGLRVGDSVERLRRLYPGTYIDPYKEHTEILIAEESVVTDGPLPRLTATVIDTRVASINAHLYGAGE